MRILQISPFFPPAYGFGGQLEAAYQVAKSLAKRGHEVVVYTSDAKDWNSRLNVNTVEYLDGMEVHYFRHIPSRLIKNLFITPGLIPKARQEVKEFDVIHLHGHWSFQNAVIHHYAMKNSIPYVIQAHGSVPIGRTGVGLKQIYDRLVGSRVLHDASKAIAVTPMELEQYRQRAIPPHKLELIPNGIDLSKSSARKGRFRKKYSIDDNAKLILFLGRLHPVKGVNLLIDAFARLKDEFDDIRLVIVGPDDGALSDLRTQVQTLGLTSTVLFTGLLYDKDKMEAYADADVFVLPSLYEIFGIVILEAFAFSLPVVASNLPSIAEFVRSGKTGLLFKLGNVEELVTQISKILRDQDLGRKMGNEGRKLVEKEYSIDKIAGRIEALYKTLLD